MQARWFLLFGTMLMAGAEPRAQEDSSGPVGEDADRTLAPYFFIAGGDPKLDRLPLKETSADVQIAGVVARVRVHQVFDNSGDKPIEAVYVFPASTRAAVHGMRMKIGPRVIEAHIDRKQAAHAEYEQAKTEGKRAALLDQGRSNVLSMRVANVMPKDRIEVQLDYSELLIPHDAVYELVYPGVVGPRYPGGASPTKDRWIASAYLPAGERETYTFDVRVHLETGIAIKDVSSPSHAITVSKPSPS
ncbi:MAG TPA: VIT domain-containing protein, partial [Polyangia bacterium]